MRGINIIFGQYMLPIGYLLLIFGCAHDMSPKNREYSSLSKGETENILLYAELDGSFLFGKVFNRNSNITVRKITIEVIPKDENNIYNKFSPRFFDVELFVATNSMSPEFRVETGSLNPDFHTLRIANAWGEK